jgi:3-oxoacyl-[acyl-carrier-protein] synthase II
VNPVVTGWSLYLPGVRPQAGLAAYFGSSHGEWAGEWADAEAPPAERAAEVLGRKGLLYKEPATRLALCAVHRALGLPAKQRITGPVSPRTAVVAAGNLGNLQTVAKVARAAATEGGRAVSILDAPNVSSNIVASTVALWFGFGGPNLMVCSGATAGLDALRLSLLLLRARRADRVVLVGTEPADEVATRLHATTGPATPLTAGAACVVLEPPAVPALVELRTGAGSGPDADVVVGPGGFDPAARWGDHYGAEGVIALALAAHLVADGHGTRVDVHDAVRVGPGRKR